MCTPTEPARVQGQTETDYYRPTTWTFRLALPKLSNYIVVTCDNKNMAIFATVLVFQDKGSRTFLYPPSMLQSSSLTQLHRRTILLLTSPHSLCPMLTGSLLTVRNKQVASPPEEATQGRGQGPGQGQG